MKLAFKIILIVCFFCSVAFADGQYPAGGFTGGGISIDGKTNGDIPNGGFTSGEMTSEFTSGEMTSGGRIINSPSHTDSALTFIQKYLISTFG